MPTPHRSIKREKHDGGLKVVGYYMMKRKTFAKGAKGRRPSSTS